MNDDANQATFGEPPVLQAAVRRLADAPLKRMHAIPPREGAKPLDEGEEIALAAISSALKHSEARRDAVVAVALAIKRRGQNPVLEWTTRDIDTAYAIAEQLIMLETT